MDARSRTLEITVISGKDLHIDRNSMLENAYVVVRTESLSCCTTRIAANGGSHPAWNEKLLLSTPMHAKFITFEVQCKTSKGVIKKVGVARIPLSDLLHGDVSESCLQILSYRLRDWEGRQNGIINFSVKVKTPENLWMSAKDKNFGELQAEIMRCQVGDQKNSNAVFSRISVW